MAVRDLIVRLVGEDNTGGAFGSAGNNADGLGSKMASVGKVVAVAFAGAAVAGVAGFGAALFQGVKDAASYQQITSQLAQTLASTGNAAGTSIGALKTYAGQLESMSGVDEELILSSQNVLATFTQVKNKIGEGNDVFDQASLAALNLSTTMGGDLQGATVMVGKALNDPIVGIGALRKAGVALTEQQQEQIKTMVASGDSMGAQKIILKELETQFGGAAKAAGEGLTGSLARAQDAFSDIFRELGTRLLPKLTEVAVWASDKLPVAFAAAESFVQTKLVPAFASLSDWWNTNGPAITAAAQTMAAGVIAAFQTVGAAVIATVNFFREHDTAAKALGVVVAGVMAAVTAAWIAQAGVAVAQAARSVGSWLIVATASTTSSTIQSRSTAQIVVGWLAHAAGAAAGAVRVVAGWVATGVGAIAAGAVMVAQVALQVARWAFLGAQSLFHAARVAAAWLIAMGPIGFVIAAVIGVVALIVANWDTIRAKTEQMWNMVKIATAVAWDAVKGYVKAGVDFLVNLFLNFTPPGLIIKHWDTVRNATGAAWAAVRDTVGGAVNAVMGAISGLGAIPGRVAGWFGGARDAAGGALGGLVSFVGSIPGRILGALGNLGGMLVNAGRELMEGLARGIGDKIQAVVGKVRDAVALIGRLLPGSPIKDGPLKSWNNGGAGKRLMGMLAGGIESGQGGVRSALTDALDIGGMAVGGTGFVNSRLAATSAPVESGSRNLTVNINGNGESIDADRLMVLIQRAERLAGV